MLEPAMVNMFSSDLIPILIKKKRKEDMPLKKEYKAPFAEKVTFDYRQQVTASSDEECDEVWTRKKGTGCHEKLVSYGD